MKATSFLGFTSALVSDKLSFFCPNQSVADLTPRVSVPVDTADCGGVSRSQVLRSMFMCSAAGVLSPAVAGALDMEAFMNAELEKDKKDCDPKRDPKCSPQLSADEAMCKYGQSGNARGEACKRLKEGGASLPTKQSQGKSLGGAYAM